jgi:hypothetical protein
MAHSGIASTQVQCDSVGCDWSQEVLPSDVENWHNKACPKCGYSPIINDDDMAVLNVALGLVHLSAALDPHGDMPTESVKFNTRKLREKNHG